MAGASGRPRGRPRKNQIVAAPPPATAPINTFIRVSKQPTAVTTEKAAANVTPLTPSARKRKAARSPEPEEVTAATPSSSSAQRKILTKPSKKARVLQQFSEPPVTQAQEPSTPRAKSTKKRAYSPTPDESPRTKEAGNLFKRLRIDATPTAARKPSPLAAATTTTSAASSVDDDYSSSSSANDAESSTRTTPEPEPLPQELLDLVSLYAAFLKTIVLHYAHNGTNTPVDLRQLSQPVSIAWGKRRISLADVRRCVGIMDTSNTNDEASPFFLADYGAKKVCVELREAHHATCLDEPRLVAVFERNLRRIWEGVKDAAADDIASFVLGLPKAAVQACESAVRASTLFAKGQRAMDDLKKSIAAKKDAQEAMKAAAAQSSTATGPKLSLLERLRLKEEQLASLAAIGPSAAELERQAALQRAGDIAAVVAMLAKSASSAGMGGRVSFTMANLLQKLKDSLRLPISKDEGAACVRLLASEVAPEWLRIVTIGGMENVVVTVGRAPSTGMVAERVKNLSG